MNKAQLISTLASTTNLTRRDADVAVNSIFNLIIEQLRQGDKVQIVGFGSFEVKARPARTARNPRTGETMEIAASKNPTFKAGKALKDAVAE